MRIILNGTSSSGKTSIIKLLPNNVKKISMDGFFDKIYCDRDIKPPESLYKNKYYTKKQKDNIFKYYIWKYYKSEIKNSKNFIIDLVDVEDQLSLKKYLSINNIKNVLLYTNLDNLIRNIDKRKNYEPRGLSVFDQFTKIYTSTNNENEAIDIICLKDFIKNLKNIKYLFSNEKELITFAKKIFKKLNIKRLQINKNYYIKSICKYDIVLNSTNKTSKKLVKELYQ
tara:strand:+ start:2808 stop:3485 length:678 start_codon:yes stop_codon:yes gene_type:complete